MFTMGTSKQQDNLYTTVYTVLALQTKNSSVMKCHSVIVHTIKQNAGVGCITGAQIYTGEQHVERGQKCQLGEICTLVPLCQTSIHSLSCRQLFASQWGGGGYVHVEATLRDQ